MISWQVRARKLLQCGFFVSFFGTREAKWICIIEDADELEVANAGPCSTIAQAFRVAESQMRINDY